MIDDSTRPATEGGKTLKGECLNKLNIYRKGFTAEEYEQAGRLMGEGRTIAEISRTMSMNRNRASRMVRQVEAQRIAIKYREDEVLPRLLRELLESNRILTDMTARQDERMTKLVSTIGALSKRMGMARMREKKLREDHRDLKATERRLRDLIRSHGLLDH